jgi:hypothetical protein
MDGLMAFERVKTIERLGADGTDKVRLLRVAQTMSLHVLHARKASPAVGTCRVRRRPPGL